MNQKLPTPSNHTNQPALRLIQKAILMVLLVFASVSGVKAQVANYQLDQLQITPTFALLPNTGSPIKTNLYTAASSFDSGVNNVTFPVGFDFQFNGATQTAVNISMNGFLTFGATAPAAALVTPISSATGYSGAISAYGADLDLITSSAVHNVSWIVVGSAPNRIFKTEWHVNRSDNAGTTFGVETTNFIFQIWLYETTDVVEIHYSTLSPGNAYRSEGQIGLRGNTNTDFKNVIYSAATPLPWPALPATMPLGGVNTATVALKRTDAPINTGSNRLFRFTPVTCFAPTAVTSSLVTATSATISWTAPALAPANGYEYYVGTSAGIPAGPTGSTAAGITTANITGLTPGIIYYIYVRSVCSGTDTSGWSAVAQFTTGCTPSNIPYFNYIDPFEAPGFTVPAIPPCTTIQNIGTGNNWVTEGPSLGDGFFDEHLVYNASGSQAANVWWFTKGVNLVAGSVYRLSYTYGGSTDFAFITNKMQVAYGTAPANAAMTITLANHPNIKASPIVNVVNFTATATGTFYFGYRAYSAANQGKLFLDDIEIVPSICIEPTGLAAPAIAGTTATITWNAPSPAPLGGYAYYVSTVNTPPAYDQVPSGVTGPGQTVVNLTGLTGNTQYYFWVRGNCIGGDFSQWSAVLPFLTLPQPIYTYCTPAPTSIDVSGIVNVTVGSINNSTGDEPGHYGNYSAMITNIAQGQTVTVAITFNTGGFNYNTKIWIDWNNNSVFSDAGENVYTGLSASSSPNTLNATFVVPLGAPLGEHRMRIGGADIDLLNGYAAGQGPCYTGAWGTFEDYTVKVTVPPPALTLSSNSTTQCAGTPSPVVTLLNDNYDTYTWSPLTGISGDEVSGWTFSPSSTITYTLTGAQNSLPFSTNTASFTYFANPLPTPIVVTPATPTSCQSGPAVQLTATGGVVSGLAILYEDFNGTAPSWTTVNNSTLGNVAAPAWTLRPSGYNPAGSSGISSVISNDATQFMISNSDAQGSGTFTDVTLTSPPFSLAGYTNASLDFFHYYKPWINGIAKVEIFNSVTSTWTTVLSWGNSSTTPAQGTPTNFAHVVYDMSAYIGMANIQVRFNYTASWGFVWAIDNFLIAGSASSSITWAPLTGLWNNAAATVPYTGTGANTVYALPSATTIYTASASTPMPTVCATNTPVTVTVTPIVPGTVTPTTQTICGAATPLVLAGFSGTITEWQYATTAAFTTPVSIPSSASATLTAAQIGALSANRWYRAVITNGGCTAYSNIVSITVSTTTWSLGFWSAGVPNATRTAIFAGNYTSTGNITACSVIVNSGNVVFNSGHSLIVTNSVTKNGGSLTFEDDASLVQINDAAVNTGNIVYKRNTMMRQYDYTYWSSPLSPQTLVGLSPLTMADKYFQFNTTGNSYQPVNSNNIMDVGRGYIIRAPQTFTPGPAQAFTATFTGGAANNGVPNNGLYNTTMPIYGPGPNNFNLVGNPYPCALDADLFLLFPANDAITIATLYFWTHNTPIDPLQYTGSDYAIYNLTGGVGTGVGTAGGGAGNLNVPTRYIAAGQGFFIKGSANGFITFNNSMRATGSNTNFYRVANENALPGDLDKSRVWLEMKNGLGNYKQTLVGYIESATNDKDENFDGDMVEAGNPISLYSVLGADKLGIQGRALPFDVNDVVPIGYRSNIAGSFEMNLADFDGAFLDQDVYLEDLALNVIHDLKSGPYSFATETGTFDDRFLLRYTDGALGVGNPTFDANSVVVYKNDSGIHINTSNTMMKSVKIFDIRGRLILNKTEINSNETVIANLKAEEQVLLVQITAADNRVVTKKIVY